MSAERPPGRGGALLAVVLTVLGGLALAGGTTADWITERTTREIAGVPMVETETTPGTELASAAVVVGLAAALMSVGLGALSGRARQVVGVLVALVGGCGAVVVAVGVARAATQPGGLSAAPFVATLGSLMVVVGGLLATRRPQPQSLGEHYTVEAAQRGGAAVTDDEWQRASVESDEAVRGGPHVTRDDRGPP